MSELLTFGDAVATYARLRPHKPAVRDTQRDLTFAAWHERGNRLANGLLDLGLDRGDRVVVLAYNCVEWMEIYVALARAGLVAVPVNFRLTPAEIRYVADHCEAKAVIAQHSLADRFAPIRADLAVAGGAYVVFGSGKPPKGWRGYEGLIADASATNPAVTVDPAEPSALLYTSGTTGRPKGAVRSHAANALLAMATALEFRFGENVYPSEVEAVIAANPDVKDVAVIGVPHDKWGEAVHALVILHDGRQASEAEIIDWCRSRVAGYKRPRSVAFIAEADMPRTATGKIQHRVLRDRHRA